MLSHIFTQFIVLLGQITITLVFVFLVFKIPCNGPVGWIVVIAILQGFAGMCYGDLTFGCSLDLGGLGFCGVAAEHGLLLVIEGSWNCFFGE